MWPLCWELSRTLLSTPQVAARLRTNAAYVDPLSNAMGFRLAATVAAWTVGARRLRNVSKVPGIRDVAARSGYSIATVSYVLNNAPNQRINEGTRTRILQVAAELNYRPNRVAQGLRTQRTHIVGLISDSIATTPYAGGMISGAQDAAVAAGYMLLLVPAEGIPEREDAAIQALIEHQVDGVIYASMFHRTATPPRRLKNTNAVFLDARTDPESFSSVVPDEVEGGRAAVAELLFHGHRRVGFITDAAEFPAAQGRLLGYRLALQDHDIPFDPALVAAGLPETAGGIISALELLRRPDRPTALFCFNDRMAFGAYHAIAECGLAIPHDMSVIGFDDQKIISEGLRPGLTTMALPHYEMGAWATKTLIQQIEDPDQPIATYSCPAQSCVADRLDRQQ